MEQKTHLWIICVHSDVAKIWVVAHQSCVGESLIPGEMTRSLACWCKPTNQEINERLLTPETSPLDPDPGATGGNDDLSSLPTHNSDLRDSYEYIEKHVWD